MIFPEREMTILDYNVLKDLNGRNLEQLLAKLAMCHGNAVK